MDRLLEDTSWWIGYWKIQVSEPDVPREFPIFNLLLRVCIVRDSSIGIAIRYGLDDPGIESHPVGARFSTPFRTGPGVHPVSCTMGTASLAEGQSGRGMALTTQSSAEVKERIKLYLYSPSGPSWAVLGWTLPLCYLLYVVLICHCCTAVVQLRIAHVYGFILYPCVILYIWHIA